MPRSRRVMVLMHYFHADVVGGAEVQAYLLSRELARNGYEVVYLCDHLHASSPRTERRDGITIWRWFRSLPLFKILNLPVFLLALLRFRPDVIYHRYASQYTVMGGIARLFGVRFIWNCCEDKHLEPGYFRNILRQHFKTYRGNPLKKGALYADAWLSDLLFSLGCRFSSAAVAQNRAQQEGIQQRFAKKPRIIRSGHPQAEHAGLLERAARMQGAGVLQGEGGGSETLGRGFGPEHRNGTVHEEPAENRTIRVLWLATLQKRKRPEFLLDIAERCMDLPAIFILAGRTSNESYREALADRAAGLGNVELRHVDSYERSWKEFENAHLYLCTSESEGFPNAFIQAWICGVPVISLGIDPDNFISEHGLGFVCSTVDEMAQKVRLLVENAPLRERMGNEVRRVAERHFDIRSVAKDFETILFDREPEEQSA